MHISPKMNAVYFLLLVVSVAISGCASSFEEVYGSAKQICPDPPDKNKKLLYNTKNPEKKWLPTDCQAVVLSGAINHCLEVTKKSVIGNFVLGGIATGIGAITASKGLIIGGAVQLGSLVGGIHTFGLVPGVPKEVIPRNMVDAAASVAEVSQHVYYREGAYMPAFYAELWNAAGSACPANLPVAGLLSFDTVRIDYGNAILPKGAGSPQSSDRGPPPASKPP